jgi:hypothetical protein
MPEQDPPIDTDIEQPDRDLSEIARLAIEKAQNYAGYDNHKRSRAVNLITKANFYKCDGIIKLFLEPAEPLQLHPDGFSYGVNPIESDLAKELIKIRSGALSRLLKFVSQYDGIISYVIIGVLHKNGNLRTFAEILRKMDEQDYHHLVGLFMEMPLAEYLETIKGLCSEETEKLPAKISALLPKRPKTSKDPEVLSTEKITPTVIAEAKKEATLAITAETKEQATSLISTGPDKDPFYEQMPPLAKAEHEYQFEIRKQERQARISDQPFVVNERMRQLKNEILKLKEEKNIQDARLLREKERQKEEQRLQTEKYYQETAPIKKSAAPTQATIQTPIKPTLPPTVAPSVPRQTQVLRPPSGAIKVSSPVVTTRRAVLSLILAATGIFALSKLVKLSGIVEELMQNKDELIKIKKAFDGISLIKILTNATYYTGLLVRATEIIDNIIALMDKITKEDICVASQELKEARAQADKIINRFDQGDMHRIRQAAHGIKGVQVAKAEAARKAGGVYNKGRVRIDGLLGSGTTDGLVKKAKGLIMEGINKIPGIEEEKLMASYAKEAATIAVSLADFILATETLVAKIKELKTSFDSVECKEDGI